MEKKAPTKTPNLEILGWVRFLNMTRKQWAEIEALYATKSIWVDITSERKWGAERIRMAEEYLAAHGWRVNKVGKVVRIRGGKGADLLGECVWELYSKEHAHEGNTENVRRKIAAELAPYHIFNADELSPKSKALIYMAIYNREYRRL
jgi:hypothetical protein